MNQTRPPGGRRWPPNRKRALFGTLLVLSAVVTLFPPLYWAAGSGSDLAVLLYFLGGSAVVLASILVMYAVERAQDRRGEVRS